MPPSLLSAAPTARLSAEGEWVDFRDERYYRISDAHLMPPFLMNLVSASDLWMFVASNGALTAGRRDADGALFPYQTVDRIYDSAGVIGPATLLQIETSTGRITWEPFAPGRPHDAAVRQTLYKNVVGDRLWLEEEHATLGLIFRYGWSSATEQGFVRECELINQGNLPVTISVLDGLRHLLPAGIGQRLQAASSNLADAYKTAELRPGTTFAIYALSSGIVDRPMPIECLRASTVWSRGLPGATLLLSDAQVPLWRAGRPVSAERSGRGRRGAYWLAATVDLAPGQVERWCMVADTGLDQGTVTRRCDAIADTDPPADCRRATDELRALIDAADGGQAGGDETLSAHHAANVLFNLLRGGTFVTGGTVPRDDFIAHLGHHNHAAATRHATALRTLPDSPDRSTFLRQIDQQSDPDLTRIAREYLPLAFSRRHGDPSRPWNRFSIRLRDDQGRRLLTHEGNWRDIFQNWEALCLSYPSFLDAVIAKFLNASTADGFNPYRISQNGIDWEVPDPEDPWSSIGYWGDHQVIYLLKLLEWSHRLSPHALPAALREPAYSYANVPYRLVDYERMRESPRDTIHFDRARHRTIEERIGREGADARLVADPTGRVLHVSLIEKLLVLINARLTHLIPDGGIWMNTQRPEWNDANNALVGYGVSVVTLAYLRRLLAHVRRVFGPALGPEPIVVSAPVANLTRTLHAILIRHGRDETPGPRDAPQRRAMVDELATAGSHYRQQVYEDGLAHSSTLDPAAINDLWVRAQTLVDESLRANQRADGLFHAYNLLEFTPSPAGLALHRLPLMLEGQVAVLSAGSLSPSEVVALLEALRHSALHRPDQHSYLLYPNRELPGFLERNIIPPHHRKDCPLLAELLAAGHRRLVEQDAGGALRFQADIVNDEILQARLDELARDPRWTESVATHRQTVEAIHEEVFRHRAYTGRSGSMFGFEGLGSIYWHMVAKLLLAVQETLLASEAAPEQARLIELYYDIRAGLGFNKSPAEYGAFPTDPYSHTPGHAGAQQPGMTGQVKEEILTRFGELGVEINDGRVAFRPRLLRAREFASIPGTFTAHNLAGQKVTHDLPAHALAFTYAGVPVIYRLGPGPAEIRVEAQDATWTASPGTTLSAAQSASLFARAGQVRRIEVKLGETYRPLT